MNRIKELRKQKGLTLDQLAIKTGINRGSLSNYELEKTELKKETWIQLAAFFNVTVSYLMGIEGSAENYLENKQCQDFMIYLKDGQELMIWDTFENLLLKMQTKKAFVVKTSEDDKYIVNPSNILWIGD